MKNLFFLVSYCMMSLMLPLQASAQYSTTSKSIVLCESYDKAGIPSGINNSWVINKDGGYIYILYRNGTATMKSPVSLYIDKENSKGEYVAYDTKEFDVTGAPKWSVFDMKFTEPGKYKVAAVNQNGTELAVSYCTISYKDAPVTTTTTTNKTSTTTGKKIVLCDSYDVNGKASGIYSIWNIKEDGGYVYVLYDNNGKAIKNTLWLYVDKKNAAGEYVPFDTKTFENTNGKTWAVYDFQFKESGEYKISAVGTNGNEATTYATIKFADGVKVKETQKSIVLCDSYDDYGKAIGPSSTWNISKDKGWIYILYSHGEPIKSSITLYIDKKNTSGKYVAYATKSFTYDGKKDWSVFDYNFTEAGDYKISALSAGTTLATTTATLKYLSGTTTTASNPTTTTTTTTTKDKVDTWYYDKSSLIFGEKANSSGEVITPASIFYTSGGGKDIKITYKDTKACKTTKVYVDIYSLDGDQEDFLETKELTTLSTQTKINTSYYFPGPGKYKVAFYNKDNTYMNLATFEIQKTGTVSNTNTYASNNTSTTSKTSTSTYTSPGNKVSVSTPRIALVIGNGNYKSVGTLPNPVHDAEEMSKLLKECGFEVVLVLNGTKKQMNEAIATFGQKLVSSKGATGMVYYAGHGIQSKGENYIIPIDAEVYVEEDLQYECLNVGKILAKMEAAKNPINIIALDACRNNPFERSWNRSGSSSGLVGMNAPEGTIISFSTNPGNTASDGSGYNSPYTTAFLNQLKKPGLTIEQVLKGIAAEVKKSTPGQLPWYSSSITGEFYFRP